MTNLEFVAAIEPFARKVPFGHLPESNIIRFAQYEIGAENFMPDLSRYELDLGNFCLLISHLDMNIDETMSDQNRRVYDTNFLIVRACEIGNKKQEADTINEAQLRAEWLWATLKHYEACVETPMKRKGKFLDSVRLGKQFRINDLVGMTDNACGVEIQLSFLEDITFQNIVKKYPTWN